MANSFDNLQGSTLARSSEFLSHESVQVFQEIATPLTKLTKTTNLQWSSEANQAFDKMKKALTNNPTVAIIDPTLPYKVMIDASERVIGAVLMQHEHAIAFDSHMLTNIQTNVTLHSVSLRIMEGFFSFW